MKYIPFLLLFFIACKKKTPDTPIATVPERIEIIPVTKSIKKGDTAIFKIQYYNNLGKAATTPGIITWLSDNATIATIDANGVAKGLLVGQTNITAKYNNITATAVLTVVANNTDIATITVETKELKLNESSVINAIAKNNNGDILTGASFTWEIDNTTIATVNGNMVTGKSYGTTTIKATSGNIMSAPAMLQVIRSGNFTGAGSAGTIKLKIENGTLKLETGTDFVCSTGAPDLRIYLTNNNAGNNITGALEIATLNQRTGKQSWNVPTNPQITQFRYVLIWCKQFGGNYGFADLGM